MVTYIKGNDTSTFGGEIKTIDEAVISNGPAFSATLSANQTGVSSATWTKIIFDTEILDTNSAFDNATNYRFTVPSGKSGKYFVSWSIRAESETTNNLYLLQAQTYKNGIAEVNDQIAIQESTTSTYYANKFSTAFSRVYDLSDGDYLELYVKVTTGSGTARIMPNGTFFNVHKLIV